MNSNLNKIEEETTTEVISVSEPTPSKTAKSPVKQSAQNHVPQAPRKPTYERVIKLLKMVGLGFLEPLIRLIVGDDPKRQLKRIWLGAGVPLIAFIVFVVAWQITASTLKSDLGKIPSPSEVWGQSEVLWKDHVNERKKEKAFFERVEKRNAKLLARNPQAKVRTPAYTGKPTFIDQIITSLKTVFAGFLLASFIALPIGIFMGLSKTLRIAINPLVQIFKPVSPVVWLLLVTMFVSALISQNVFLGMPKAFIISFISVALCSMWPTLVNTSVGVSSVDKDFINVARVLRLNTWNKIVKVVLPASLPLVFTGLRISLSIAWMVLIAIELLAQNPGLGKFVWDEFQNGSTDSNAKIIVALFVIGSIGFALDRIMVVIQKMVTFNKNDIA